MSDFKTKMHQIRFRLGLRPRPRREAYSAPQTPSLDLGALLLRGGGGEGREGEDGREGNGGKGREGEGLKPSQSKFSGYGADD